MSYEEFCDMIAPSVVRMQDEARKMSESEYRAFRKSAIRKIRNDFPGICEKFMEALFDLIQKNVFQAA